MFGASVLALALVHDGAAQDDKTVHHIVIERFAFQPAKITAKVGDTIEWINNDVVPHTATALDKSWDTGRMDKGESLSVVITEAGKIEYVCAYHLHMKGEIVTESTSDNVEEQVHQGDA